MINKLLLITMLATAFHFAGSDAYGQDQAKSITASGFLKKRPAASEAASKFSASKPVTASLKPAYRMTKAPKATTAKAVKRTPKGKRQPPVSATDRALLGFTIWRFQPASDTEDMKGLVEVDAATGKKQLAERSESSETYAIGEQLRIGIESLSHDGYLYVIDREKYADGSSGAATLVYPTLRTRAGNNAVKAGVLTFIPEAPRKFQITSNTARKQVAEELIIIVSPKPLIDAELLQIKPIEIASSQLAQWMKWRVDEIQLEQIGGAGQTMAMAERTAGEDQSKGLTEVLPTLTQDDPPPQTIYEMSIKRGDPFVASLLLPIKPE